MGGLPKGFLRRTLFLARDDGSMTVLALFLFVGMLLIAGLAVDLMRHEHERVRLQGAVDRAALAAANLRPSVSGATPEGVARAFLEAEGFGDLIDAIEVNAADGLRDVAVSATGAVPATLARLAGIDRFPLTVSARAQDFEVIEQIPIRLEVVLVLDVTGSMGASTANGLTRIENLRLAAADLVRALLTDRAPGEVALTLVPYAEYVLPPPGFIQNFVQLPLSGGACVDFLDWGNLLNSFLQPVLRPSCATHAWRPYVHDLTQALSIVNALEASGTTSIDLGLRFGALFFDPTINPAIRQMVANGTVDPAFGGHPLPLDARHVFRAVVLMTDGENCCGRRYPVDQQDAQTLQVCAALKNLGVTIYAVAFEAPRRGIELMRACASSEGHFFNTSAGEIAAAFSAIGSDIERQAGRLRLVQ